MRDLAGRMVGIGDRVVRLLSQAEDDFYLQNIADNTKLGPRQGRSLYELVRDVADTLDAKMPHVFLDTDPVPNAAALGGSNPSIVISSGLLDGFPPEALRAVVAHELGHIVCGHTYYRLLANNASITEALVGLIPVLGPLLTGAFRALLMDWYRKSELSADRAALLGTQDPRAVQACIMHLAGGSTRLAPELSPESFGEQAEEYRQLTSARALRPTTGVVGWLFGNPQHQQTAGTHPWPAVRLEEIASWGNSRQYKTLAAGDLETPRATEVEMRPTHYGALRSRWPRSGAECGRCGQAVAKGVAFCASCSRLLPTLE